MPSAKLHFGPLKDNKLFLTIHQTPPAADAVLYEGYDPLFLSKKAAILYGIYKNTGAFQACSESWDVRVEVSNEDLQSMLATELHNASFHQAAAMLALLLAEFQSRPDWVYLTSYGNADIKNAAKAIAAEEFGAITGGACTTGDEFVKAAVFAACDFSSAPEIAEAWGQSLKDISWLIHHVAEHLAAGLEYNAYKHGLRVVLGSATLGVSSAFPPADLMPLLEFFFLLLTGRSLEGRLPLPPASLGS